jgi:molybdenum cofactor cytidylyltransferase
VVVVRQDDVELSKMCAAWPVTVVQPDQDPPDMKASIQIGLRHVSTALQPSPHDLWMVAPADMPELTSQLIDRVASEISTQPRVVVPRFAGRAGHPVLLPWQLAQDVFRLQPDAGLDQLLARTSKTFLDLPADQYISDVDTPDEYARMRKRG